MGRPPMGRPPTSRSKRTGYRKHDFYLPISSSDLAKKYNQPENGGPEEDRLEDGSQNKIPISKETGILILSYIGIILMTYFVLTQQKNSAITEAQGKDGPTKVLGLVGVQTTYESADRRAALRTTWFPNHCVAPHIREKRLAFVFVIGKAKGTKKREIEEEKDQYGDILILKESEDISRLEKTLAFFKAASNKFEAEYYIKADDDIYLRPDKLATLLSRKKTKPLEYIGCKKKERLKKNKDLVFARGNLYILSAKAVKKLGEARTGSLPESMPEDYAIGYLMDILTVKLEEQRDLCQSHCTPKFIAVWNFSSCSAGACNTVTKLKELHMSSACSKTPTTIKSEQL